MLWEVCDNVKKEDLMVIEKFMASCVSEEERERTTGDDMAGVVWCGYCAQGERLLPHFCWGMLRVCCVVCGSPGGYYTHIRKASTLFDLPSSRKFYSVDITCLLLEAPDLHSAVIWTSSYM